MMRQKSFMVLAIFLLSIVLNGCGINMSSSPNLGVWNAESASMSGVELDVNEVMTGAFSLSLNEDGSCELHIGDHTESGKWKDTEDGFIVEDSIIFKTNGDRASCDYDGVHLNFKRVKKTTAK